MKRIALYFGIAAALVASCSTREIDLQTPIQDETVFYATFEQPGDGITKVYANEDLLLRWTADDRVSIFNKITYNQQYKFTGETGDNAGGFRKVDSDEFVTGNTISHVVSVYPYQETTKITESEVLTVTLPAEQSYAENTFGLGANTMASVSSDNVLQYKNVGGYLMLKLYGEGVSVESIRLKGNNGEKLAGKASISMPLDGTPTAVMADEATTEITLTCATPVQLGATEEESTQFWFVVPPVTFSKGFTITVNVSSGGIMRKSTTKSVTIERSNLSKMAPMEVVVPVPEAVDMGLSVKWASFNLGASKPEEYGDYYAWGETEPYYNSLDPLTWKEGKATGYDWSSYKWCMGEENTLIKYCNNSEYGFDGFTDTKTVLDLEDDAANVALGVNWRMPTDSEWTELRENCTWTWTTQNGVNGRLVTASNGNSIFLPVAGGRSGFGPYELGTRGHYWSSFLYVDDPNGAWSVHFNSGSVGRGGAFRYTGFSIRPVFDDRIDDQIHPESVSLNITSLSLEIDKSEQLTAVVYPANAKEKSVSWSSSDPTVADVSSSGVVAGVAVGSAIITVTTIDGSKTATCIVNVKDIPVPVAVDMGLSVKWASFNLGASKPEEYGDYYAWGETETKDDYSWTTYKWSMRNWNTMTKYCNNSEYGYNGFTDTKAVLDPEDDAARVNWGGTWRMPTDAEWMELMANCTWTWTTQNGVNGRLVTASNSNSIFLPAAGWWIETDFRFVGSGGLYWSSSLYMDGPCNAWSVGLNSDEVFRDRELRYGGYSVRPVSE